MLNGKKSHCDQFVSNLKDIYSNTREYITDGLRNVDPNSLPLIRMKLYILAVEMFPELEQYDLSITPNMHTMIEDIYEIGRCVAHGSDTNQVKKVLIYRPGTDLPENDNEQKGSVLTNSMTSAVLPKNFKRAKLCMDNCKFKGKNGYKKEDTVQCHMCQHWTHPSCVGENDKNIVGIWTCPSCRTTPDLIHTMYTLMYSIQQGNAEFKNDLISRINSLEHTITERDRKIQELTNVVVSKSNDLSDALREVEYLRTAVSEINVKLSAQSWKNFRHKSQEKTLLAGSSIIRDISETCLDNTDVACRPGGRINDITEIVKKTPSDKYSRIVLVAGGNNCDQRDLSTAETPSEIVDQFRSLVSVCKQKAPEICVSSICPRLRSPEIVNRIESTNAGLQVMCEEENVTYIDNSTFFYLKDNSVNDAYLLTDGCHLTHKAADKLALNLKLKLKDGIKSVCSKQRHRTSGAPSSDTYENFSHSFWNNAKQKHSSTIRGPRPMDQVGLNTNKEEMMDTEAVKLGVITAMRRTTQGNPVVMSSL